MEIHSKLQQSDSPK